MNRYKNLSKKNIANNLVKELELTQFESQAFIDSFLKNIKQKLNTNIIKINKFGTFYLKKSKKRVGRNPKTLIEYDIPSKNRVSFKLSNNLRKKIN